jgi:hypothetical protein
MANIGELFRTYGGNQISYGEYYREGCPPMAETISAYGGDYPCPWRKLWGGQEFVLGTERTPKRGSSRDVAARAEGHAE